MDFLLMLKAAILGVVEGLTEFLPISSTGHLILTQSLLGLHGEFWDSFEVAIQFGAILAVMWVFRARILSVACGLMRGERSAVLFVLNMVIATVPAVLLALVFGKTIQVHLFQPVPVALAFVIGGLVILWAERRQVNHLPAVTRLEDLTMLDAAKVGAAQTLAVIFPGTSRSGATIIGGMFFGLSREVATHFSFFLAMPILFAAFLKGLWDMRKIGVVIENGVVLSTANLTVLFCIGFFAALVSAFVCVRWLLKFVSNNSFVGFAWYRIGFGLLILLSWQFGWVQWA
jgi:undecaprenyl-diphosphatase